MRARLPPVDRSSVSQLAEGADRIQHPVVDAAGGVPEAPGRHITCQAVCGYLATRCEYGRRAYAADMLRTAVDDAPAACPW
jgi:hypothetical protein